MRVLVVYCHPRSDSFTAAIRDVILEALSEAGAEIRLQDLYANGFDPVMRGNEHRDYENEALNRAPIADQADDLSWCDTLIFVYPTWWYGLPAMLKGWLDRVLVPGLAFLMPDDQHKDIRPGLTHIQRLGVFTTCGASWWLTRWIGAPGRRTLLRGLRILCAPRCRTIFAAHYLMDSSTPESRAKHLDRVRTRMRTLIGPPMPQRKATA